MSVVPPKRERTSEYDGSTGKQTPDIDTKSIRSTDSDDLVDAEPKPFQLFDYLFRRRLYKPQDLDAISTRRSVYDDPQLAPHYWPKANYENIHRFDIKARWTFGEEKVRPIVFISKF